MMDRHQQIIATAVLLIAGGASGFQLGRVVGERAFPAPRDLMRSAPAPQQPPAPEAAGLGSVLVSGNAIAVNDQPPGLTVVISMVTLAQDGWVVIHEGENGKPGRILGARRFNAGMNQSGSVELLRPTEEGRVYFAMLHADDGDRQFDHRRDLPLADPQGNVILMRFVATASPAER